MRAKTKQRRNARNLAQQAVKPLELPRCFGRLHFDDAVCRRCCINAYCESASKSKLSNELEEQYIDLPQELLGFKLGSRPDLFVHRWSVKSLTRKQLIKLSRELFDGTIIDIDRILAHLKKRKMLKQNAKLYTIDWLREESIDVMYEESSIDDTLRDLHRRQAIPPGMGVSPLDHYSIEELRRRVHE